MKELKALCSREQWTAKVKFMCDAGGDAELTGLPCVELPLHRLVLAATCPYLRGLWLGGFRENSVASDGAVVRAEGANEAMLRLLVEAAYGGTVTCAGTVELLGLYFLADRWGFSLAVSSALECISGRLTIADAEQLLKKSSPLPPSLLVPIATVLNKAPPKNMPWGTATLFLQASSEVEPIAPQLLSAARGFVGRHLCEPSVEKVGLSQLKPQLLGSALPAEDTSKPLNSALLASVLQWAEEFPAPTETLALPIAELSNLSALREAVPKDTHHRLFLRAFGTVLRAKVVDEGQHEIFASLLNTVFARSKLVLESKELRGDGASDSDRSELEDSDRSELEDSESENCSEAEEVESSPSPPPPKKRRVQDREDPCVATAAGLIEALGEVFQDKTLVTARVFCFGPRLQALHSVAFVRLMSWLRAIDSSERSSIISAWVLNASTDDVFEALRMGPLSDDLGTADCILGAARTRFSNMERLYLDMEGGKIEERIAHDVAAAEAVKERAFQAKEAELRGQLETALQELAEEKKRHVEVLAEAKSRYLAAADHIFKSLTGDGS